MRVAILLIPLVAFAAYSAGAPPTDPYGYNAMNAAEQAVANAEAAADMAMDAASNDSMDMGMDANMMDMTMGNSTAPATSPSPAWMAEGFWLIAVEEASGAAWYFEPFASDFTRSPFRVILRTDETGDAARRHNNTERRIELDCAAQSYRILSTTHYDDAGNRADVDEDGDGRMIRPAPESAWAEVVDTVCRHDANQRSGEREVTFNGM